MTQLSKWFPFMFKRRDDPEAKDSGTATTPNPRRTDLASWSPMGQWMNRMLSDDFWRTPMLGIRDFDRFFGNFAPMQFDPSIDVVDEGKFVRLSVELPGMDKNDVKLEIHDGMLMIRGEKKQEHQADENGCYRTERYYGSFQRNVPLPDDLHQDRAEAQFEKGVLTVRFPKQTTTQPPKTIEVR
jgi:HSP20 family protein